MRLEPVHSAGRAEVIAGRSKVREIGGSRLSFLGAPVDEVMLVKPQTAEFVIERLRASRGGSVRGRIGRAPVRRGVLTVLVRRTLLGAPRRAFRASRSPWTRMRAVRCW